MDRISVTVVGVNQDYSRDLLEELGKNSGYIFSPSHALTEDIPNENIKELIHIAKNQSELI